nr:immunoglobulin heavy chain junction region [Macaca mulatta]MOV57247.1 immunoglobulin heavy chain junction region [Macaca mulatta]MOV58905.1 immunoglobulin heavy chain junction region [Macaca mulatta]MOV60007.1 immunoglobulin heavy chain junction region [Macaca mulatta]MOV60525.1 immunoglobulin heavy chain junction region [Macaca mulatta]
CVRVQTWYYYDSGYYPYFFDSW